VLGNFTLSVAVAFYGATTRRCDDSPVRRFAGATIRRCDDSPVRRLAGAIFFSV